MRSAFGFTKGRAIKIFPNKYSGLGENPWLASLVD
jgi:hypothetical protein